MTSSASEWLVRFGGALWGWVGPMTVTTGMILAAALLADRLLERRVSATARELLYLAVGVRLVLPIDWRSPLGLLGGGPSGSAAVPAQELTAVPTMTSGATAPGLGLGWAAVVYLAVAFALFGHWFWARWKLHRRFRQAHAIDNPVSVYRLLGHADLGPVVAGLFRPQIVVPDSLASGASPDVLACVLRHETAHIERRDPWLGALVQVINILAWPILPVWIAARRIRILMEVACDERAVAGQDAGGRRQYGEVLVQMADCGPVGQGLHPVLSFGSPLRGRLRALTVRRRWPRWVQAVSVVGVAVAGLACVAESSVEGGRERTPRAPGAKIAGEEVYPMLSIDASGGLFLNGHQVAKRDFEQTLRSTLASLKTDRLVWRDDHHREHAHDAHLINGITLTEVVSRAGVKTVGLVKGDKLQWKEAPKISPTPYQGGEATIRGTLTPAAINDIVRAHINEVKFCYETALARAPSLEGGLVVRFTIGPDGVVASSELKESSVNHPELERCILIAVRRWQFEKPEDGHPVTVAYPFHFAPSKN